ncbi:MAG: pyridoxine 5'-phosphate synthase [Thermoanaerobaculia bacterium]
MEISISGIPYQNLKKTNPEICFSIPEYFSSIPFSKIHSLVFLYDKEQLEEIKVLNNFFSQKISIQIGATPEQMHELLSLSPFEGILSNLQRKDGCLDLLLFKEQIQELIQNFNFPKERLVARVEADPEQIKVASKLGFSKVELEFSYPFPSEKDYNKFDEVLKVASKMGISVGFGKGFDFFTLRKILKIYKPQQVIVDLPFYKIALKEGIDKAVDFCLSL